MEKDVQALMGAFNQASEAIKKGALGSCAEPLGLRRNREQNYSIRYQALVAAGVMPQIKAKYRSA